MNCAENLFHPKSWPRQYSALGVCCLYFSSKYFSTLLQVKDYSCTCTSVHVKHLYSSPAKRTEAQFPDSHVVTGRRTFLECSRVQRFIWQQCVVISTIDKRRFTAQCHKKFCSDAQFSLITCREERLLPQRRRSPVSMIMSSNGMFTLLIRVKRSLTSRSLERRKILATREGIFRLWHP